MKTRSIAMAAALAFAALMSATTTQAKEFEVRYDKAELETAAGAERVYHRIYDVAEDLCDYEFSQSFATKSRIRFDRCLRRTVKEFVWQVDHPNVDQAHVVLPVRRLKDRLTKSVEIAQNKSR